MILHGKIRKEDFSSTQRCKLAVCPSLRRCYTGRFQRNFFSAPQLCEIRWNRTCYTGRFFWRNKKTKAFLKRRCAVVDLFQFYILFSQIRHVGRFLKLNHEAHLFKTFELKAHFGYLNDRFSFLFIYFNL